MGKYKTNFLKAVILRADFIDPIKQLAEQIPGGIREAAQQHFKIADPQTQASESVSIVNGQTPVTTREISRLWDFYSEDRTQKLSITSAAVFIEYRSYDNFSDFSKSFLEPLSAVIQHFPSTQVGRIGLRYVDEIVLKEKNPMEWSEYLNDKMLSIFDVIDEKNTINRALHLIEMNKGDFNVRFQYGMHNPDYPTPILKKMFILDTDVYSTGMYTKDQIEQLIPKFHDCSIKLFENAIKNPLRAMMNEQ